MKTGAAHLCEILVSYGMKHAFGVPGSQNIALYDALRQSGIRSVLTTNELAAGFMAIGYYRASGRLAPLFTIPGPGFTWALTSIAEALQDSVALLHIVGRTPGTDHRLHLQAIDQRAIVTPLAKGTFRIDAPSDIAPEIEKAISLALGGEPGPVVVEAMQCALESPVKATANSETRTRYAPPSADAGEVVAALVSAKYPIIFVGQGANDAASRVQELAEMLGAPVISTASGRGTLPEDHPLALCFDGERGNISKMNEILARSDMVLVLGCKLGFSGTIGFQLKLPSESVMRVDKSDDVLRATCPAKVSFAESVDAFLERVVPEVAKHAGCFGCAWTKDDIVRSAEELRRVATNLAGPEVQSTGFPSIVELFNALRRALPRDAIVCADSGLHQQLLRRHFDVLAPRGLLMPSDYQSMGFGIPAAIGAKLAAPERTVVAVVGDGGFAMSGLELLTAVRENISLTVIVFNDGYLGRIRLEQLAANGRTNCVRLQNPDFEAFALAVGADYALVDGNPEPVVRACVERTGITILELRLGDGPSVHTARIRGIARNAVRKTFGTKLAKRLKDLVPRSS